MSVIHNDLLLATDEGGYTIAKSLRFRSSASAYLSRTLGTATNEAIWTFSFWVKRGVIGVAQEIMTSSNTSANQCNIEFTSSDTLRVINYIGSAFKTQYVTTQVFRDPSAWYHIVIRQNSSTGFTLYVNGTQVTSFSTATGPDSTGWLINQSGRTVNIGREQLGGVNYFDGYMTEVNFIDGQALTPSSFGETDAITGVWKPKAYTGTYGTNGFYLKFTDVATTSGSNAGLGKDFSGNGNYWTTNNISVTSGSTYDSMKDVPTLTDTDTANYCVLNPLSFVNGSAPTDGNLKCSNGGSGVETVVNGTIGVSSGKFYWEAKASGTLTNLQIGIQSALVSTSSSTSTIRGYADSGSKRTGSTYTSYGNSFTNGDIISIALDLDNGKIWFGKNGTWQASGDPVAGTNAAFTDVSGTVTPWMTTYNTGAGTSNWEYTFGQRPFAYTPPTGYKALNTYNLPDSTIVAGNKVMDATLYTGNGSTQSITNAAGFKPDLVWLKNRGASTYHLLYDSIRGVGKWLASNATAAEGNIASSLTAFNSNGFSVGADPDGSNNGWNNNGAALVGWQWKAGAGTTSSNTDGSIASTISVNASAGFSVVTYTGTGSSGTVGHGLGVAPKFMIYKARNSSSWNWLVNIGALTGTQGDYLYLNADQGKLNSSNVNNASSTTFPVSGSPENNGSGTTYVAYCWAEIPGFSKFGTYVGNGSTDGAFVYTGFRPKFIIIKSTSNASDWTMWDSSRNTYNLLNSELNPNNISNEYVANTADFLSNGFKMRSTYGNTNGSNYNYIYMAFAENPFKNSLAR